MMNQWYYESSTQKFYGLSTDSKPTGCANGSVFIEMDTARLYIYNAATSSWTFVRSLDENGITITSLAVSQSVCEKGSSQSVTVSWTLSEAPTTQTLNSVAVTGTSKSFTGVTDDTTYTLSVSDGQSSATGSVDVEFANRIYYGAAANLTSVASLTSVLSNDAEREITVNAGSGQYIVYALPARLGEVAFFVGGFEGGFEDAETQLLTNASGFEESYYVYRSTNANLGETIIDVKSV